jgi:hypothetical protein
MIFNKNDFLAIKKIKKKFLKNIKFDFQMYFNIDNTLNGRIDILNSEIKNTT